MKERKSYERPKPGIFYLIPDNKRPGKYTIYSELEEPGKDTVHLYLWDQVVKILSRRFKKDVPSDAYTGMPRGRIIEPFEKTESWIVAHGNDFPLEEYKNDILSEFSLKDAYSINKVKFMVDNHEKMSDRDRKIVESDLGIKYTKTGWIYA